MLNLVHICWWLDLHLQPCPKNICGHRFTLHMQTCSRSGPCSGSCNIQPITEQPRATAPLVSGFLLFVLLCICPIEHDEYPSSPWEILNSIWGKNPVHINIQHAYQGKANVWCESHRAGTRVSKATSLRSLCDHFSGGLKENDPHRLTCLNSSFLGCGTIWEGLGGVATLKVVCHWEQSLRFQKDSHHPQCVIEASCLQIKMKVFSRS